MKYSFSLLLFLHKAPPCHGPSHRSTSSFRFGTFPYGTHQTIDSSNVGKIHNNLSLDRNLVFSTLISQTARFVC